MANSNTERAITGLIIIMVTLLLSSLWFMTMQYLYYATTLIKKKIKEKDNKTKETHNLMLDINKMIVDDRDNIKDFLENLITAVNLKKDKKIETTSSYEFQILRRKIS